MLLVTTFSEEEAGTQAGGWLDYRRSVAALLKKYGVPRMDGTAGTAPGIFVGDRAAVWAATDEAATGYVEGPLRNKGYGALKVRAEKQEATYLDVHDAEGAFLGRLVYNTVWLRKIPRSRRERSDPYPVSAEETGLRGGPLVFDELEARGDAEPWLWGTNEDGNRHLIGVKLNNRLLVSGAPILDVILQHHVPGFYPDGYYAMHTWSDLEGLEKWLLGQIAAIGLANGKNHVSVSLWPRGFRSCLTIRHDVDRPMSGWRRAAAAQKAWITALLLIYALRGLRSTWFWRTRTYHRAIGRAIELFGHENALHTEAWGWEEWRDRELGYFRRIGVRPAGFTAHGGNGAPGYLGQTQLRWAVQSGFRYGELLGPGITLPTVALLLDGEDLREVELILPAMHRGLDLDMTPEGHCLEELAIQVRRALERGEHCIIMNHPDIHIRQLIRLVMSVNLRSAWCATMHDVARWVAWRASIVRHDDLGQIELVASDEAPADAQVTVQSKGRITQVAWPNGVRRLRIQV